MIQRTDLFAILSISCLSLTACTGDVDLQAETAGARAIVDDFWRAIQTQDTDLLAQVVADDDEMIAFGTDAAERWVGSKSYVEAEEQMMQVFDVERLARRDETLRIHGAGGVAWFSTVFDIGITVDGESMGFEGLRTTGVIEKRDDRWVIVQMHTSVPVAGQQVEYREDGDSDPN